MGVAKGFEELVGKDFRIFNGAGEQRVNCAAGTNGTGSQFARKAAHAAGVAPLGTAEQGGGKVGFARRVTLKGKGKGRTYLRQQRAVKGNTAALEKLAELLDAALVRTALLCAAAEQQNEEKHIDKQQNDDDDVFEPRGSHVRASFLRESVGKPADADRVCAALIVADTQLGVEVFVDCNGRGLTDREQQRGRIGEGVAAAVEHKTRDSLSLYGHICGVGTVREAQRCTVYGIVKGDGTAFAAAFVAAQIQLCIADGVAQQRKDQTLCACDGFKRGRFSG